jgi:AraC family transcriptional regulator
MEMGIRALADASATTPQGSRVNRPPKQMASGEPQLLASQEQSWNGVSVCEMEMSWPSASACHEITERHACLWAVVEQIGGQYEHRTDPREPLHVARPRCHAMSLVPPGMELWAYARRIRYVRAVRVTFDLDHAGLALGDRRLWPAFAEPRLMFTSDSVWQIAALLAAECSKPRGVDGLYGEGLATALCAELLRLGDSEKRPIARGGLAPWQMQRITEYMQAHLGDAIQLGDVAHIAGVSRSFFSEAFRITTGVPPYRWYLTMRIRHAQDLLLDTALPLVEIALRTGFADQSHFTKSFQRQVGTSPGAWRRTRRNRCPPISVIEERSARTG